MSEAEDRIRMAVRAERDLNSYQMKQKPGTQSDSSKLLAHFFFFFFICIYVDIILAHWANTKRTSF